MKRIIFLVLIVLISIVEITAKETITKNITEIIYQKDNDVMKLRPFYSTQSSKNDFNLLRIDMMMGRNFKKITLSTYWKFDNIDRAWTGLMIEYSDYILQNKLTLKLLNRYLVGLNSNSNNEYYFISSIDYPIRLLRVGGMGYYKKTNKESVFYIGPILSIILSKHISTSLCFSPDILGNSNLLFWKTNFKF